MSKQDLFNYYYNAMSKEFKTEILGYEDFYMYNVLCSIKVNFKNGSWIRVFQRSSGEIEWY